VHVSLARSRNVVRDRCAYFKDADGVHVLHPVWLATLDYII
jgi:hypothetical protein